MAERASARDPAVRKQVEQSLEALEDLVVWQRINRGGGSTDWYLVRSVQDFDRMLEAGQAADVFLIFLEPQLPIRGVVADPFIDLLLQEQAASEEWVMGFRQTDSCLLADARAYMPEDTEWANDVLLDHVGDQVAAGPFPPSLSEDRNVVLPAYVPQPDGTVVEGIY